MKDCYLALEFMKTEDVEHIESVSGAMNGFIINIGEKRIRIDDATSILSKDNEIFLKDINSIK